MRNNILDGSGIYRQDAILGPFEEGWDGKNVVIPHIEEIRAIKGADGEDYINLNDLSVMMHMEKFRFASISVFLFVKTIIEELITARR